MFSFLALVGAEDVSAGLERYGAQQGEPGGAGVGLWVEESELSVRGWRGVGAERLWLFGRRRCDDAGRGKEE